MSLCMEPLDHDPGFDETAERGTAIHVYCNLPASHPSPHTYTNVKSLNRGTRWLTYDVKWEISRVPERGL